MRRNKLSQHTNPSLDFLRGVNNPTIILDIDGVSADTREFFISVIENRYGVPLSRSRMTSPNPRIPEINSTYSDELKRIVEDDVGIYEEVEVMPGAAKATRKLSKKFNIKIVTHRVRKGGWVQQERDTMKRVTVEWLEDNNFAYDEFVSPTPKDKTEVEYDVLIDDRRKNIEPAVHQSERVGLMYLRPYNIMEVPNGAWVASAERNQRHTDSVSSPENQWEAITSALLNRTD
jgi:5'(3')-deoxyribonucleotidase